MYRCPRCNSELPEYARFCNKCGFNQTNARMMAIAQAQSAPPPPSGVQPVRTNTPPKDAGTPVPSAPSHPKTPAPPPAPDAAPAKGLSLTKRYIADQETRHQPTPQTQAKATPLPSTPGAPVLPTKPQEERKQRQPEQVIRTSTPPPVADLPTAHFPIAAGSPPQSQAAQAKKPQQEELSTAHFPLASGAQPDARRSQLWDENDMLLDDDSMSSLNEEAERWRNSWRARQRAEAGPAIDVSRGQASVPEPLMAMQHSLARIRAVILTRNEEEDKQETGIGFWIIVGILICLILALTAYIISTYLPGAQPSSQMAPLHIALFSLLLE
jgi:hypothetical protein